MELSDGPGRLYADPIMQDLLGVTPDITPEECYAFFLGHIHPEDRPLMNAYQQELMRGEADIVYLEEIISLYPKLSRIVKTRLQEH